MPNFSPPTFFTRGAITPFGFCRFNRFRDGLFEGLRRRDEGTLPDMGNLRIRVKDAPSILPHGTQHAAKAPEEEIFISSTVIPVVDRSQVSASGRMEMSQIPARPTDKRNLCVSSTLRTTMAYVTWKRFAAQVYFGALN